MPSGLSEAIGIETKYCVPTFEAFQVAVGSRPTASTEGWRKYSRAPWGSLPRWKSSCPSRSVMAA